MALINYREEIKMVTMQMVLTKKAMAEMVIIETVMTKKVLTERG